jgi:3'-phosphoadenosine 5'-phosphosulfate sulfotransferase (PAPS reductase)/FAD synthetase
MNTKLLEYKPSLVSVSPKQVEILGKIDLQSYDHFIVLFSGGKDSLACLLVIHDALRSLNMLDRLEVWHHEVDGREGSTLMDWACTPAYCRAVADALGVKYYASWLEGGFEREMLRENQAKAPTWFETPEGLRSAGGKSNNLNTRLKFPQVSADLRVRWCSAYLKIDVGRTALNNQKRFFDKKTLVISGERAEESPGRAKYAAFEPHECSTKKRPRKTASKRKHREIHQLRLVHSWTTAQIWAVIQEAKINPHPAYRLGFGRCSCKNCIFGSDNQQATLQRIDPHGFAPLPDYELRFRTTIHRSDSLITRAARGTPYSNIDPADIRAALSPTWDEPIFMEEWKPPAGMYGENSGPT